MKAIQELIIGSAIFMVIDRIVRLISNYAIAKGEAVRLSLYIELLMLGLTVLIAWKIL